ncbi:visual pigment-like receptor peropsin [Haliotis cracherodii]|uniref:visual pigment-like receptor peropsin n=1 Tax=Haliotis cracherodii TaxID=6455 RepID=UPI0039E7CD6F
MGDTTYTEGGASSVSFNASTKILESPMASLLTSPERTVVTGYLIFIGTGGTIGNAIILALFIRFKALRTRVNALMLNLAIADLGINVFGFPFLAWSIIRERWMIGSIGCQWYAFNGMFFGIASIGSLAAISIDRYFLTCRYHQYLEITRRHYIWLIVAVWVNALFWAAMPLVGWSRYALEPSNIACLIDLRVRDAGFISYVIMIFLICFLFPLVVIGLAYVHTLKVMRAIGEGGAQENVEWTNEKQTTKMGVIVVMLFVVGWSPYACLHLYALFDSPYKVTPLLTTITALCAKTSTVYNPVVYIAMNRRYMLALKKMFKCVFTYRDHEAIQIHNLT